MTSTPRSLRSFAAVLVAATLGLASVGTVLAEGTGDVYVANAGGVDEVQFLGPSVTAIPATGPTSLAFAANGQALYLLEGKRTIARLTMDPLAIGKQWTLPADAVAITFPKGTSLLVAYPGATVLGVLVDGADAIKSGWELDFKPTMLAGDPRETAILAAASGGPTVAIVDTALGTVASVGVGGKVAAIAIGRDEGIGYAATTSPNTLVTFELATRKVLATATLPGVPTGVTATAGAAVVAIGDKLVKVTGKDAGTLKVASGTITAVVAGVTGQVVYAAVGARLLAVNMTDPGKSTATAMASGNATALATSPYATAFETTGSSGTGEGTGTDGNGAASQAPASKPPATDTEAGDRHFRPAGADPLGTLLLATVVASVVSVGLWAVLRGRLPTH